MMKSVAFATRRLSIVLNRFGWLAAIIWIAIMAYEKNDRQMKQATASMPTCACPEIE